MPAQLLRPAASNHAFFTHDARVAACGMLLGERAVERSEERLNILLHPARPDSATVDRPPGLVYIPPPSMSQHAPSHST